MDEQKEKDGTVLHESEQEADAAQDLSAAKDSSATEDLSAAEDPQEMEKAKALHAEMEELAAVFQQELDRTAKEALDGGAASPTDSAEQDTPSAESESAEVEETDDTPAEDELCTCCGVKRRGTAKNPDSEYCAACEAGLRRYPFDFIKVFLVLAVLALVLYGGFVFAGHMPTYAAVLKADKLAAEQKLYSALDGYTAAANTMVNAQINGELVYKRELLTVYKLGGMNLVPETAKKIHAFELKLPHFRALKKAIDSAERFMATAAAGNNLVAPYEMMPAKDIPYDELLSKIDALKTAKPQKNEDKETEPGAYEANVTSYHPAMLAFYKYYAALLAEKDVATQLQFAEEIQKAAPDELWIYASLLGDLYAKSGKDVEPICRAIEKNNAEDDTADLIRASAKRIAKNPEEALALCEEKIKAESSLTVEFLRQEALCYLALNDTAAAFEKANSAFELSSQQTEPSVQLCNTYALCALAADKPEAFQRVSDIFTGSGMQLSAEVTGYRNGTVTLEDILTKGDYDL